MPRNREVNDLFRRLALEEDRFLQSEFLAPVVRGGKVRVQIAGILCEVTIQPHDFTGWGVFQPITHSQAKLVREATLSEKQRYFELLPLVRLIACHQANGRWFATPAHQGDSRFKIEGLVPVQLANEVELFETIRVRFDGRAFWYEGQEPRNNPATARYLRECRQVQTNPEELVRAELTAEQRRAYFIHEAIRLEGMQRAMARRARGERDRMEARLKQALEHAGAEFVDYLQRGDSYRVTYTVDGQRHVSAVDGNTLAVQVAGICLSGQDQKFDLSSLVGVLREANGEGGYLPIGQDNHGLDEDVYWEIHPPE